MKQYDEQADNDQILKSLDSIQLEESERKEVFTNIMDSIEKKPRKKSVTKWTNNILTAPLIAIFFIGGGYFFINSDMFNQASPSPQDPNINTIETVLEIALTAPDSTLIELSEKLSEANWDSGIPKESADLELYLEEQYKPYFTENGYNQFINSGFVQRLHMAARSEGMKTEVTNMEIVEKEETEGAYDFTVDLSYTLEGGQNKSTLFKGRAYVYEEEKIAALEFEDAGDLNQLIRLK
jgi:hypothetical protein